MSRKLSAAKMFALTGGVLLIAAIAYLFQGFMMEAATWGAAAILFIVGAYVKYKSYKDRGDNLPKY